MGESDNGRCSVKKVFFFATSPSYGYWLTCFARKGYFHSQETAFSKIILPEIRTERIRFLRNCCAINKFRTGTLYRILNYLAEYFKLPSKYG